VEEELLRTAIEEVNAAGPDLVVVGGDLTDDGYPDQYPLAADGRAGLACPLLARIKVLAGLLQLTERATATVEVADLRRGHARTLRSTEATAAAG
jgi:3',5'-cyclic AMP phosphodiesterase CpdA